MPGRVAWTKYRKKRLGETKEEREARIAREKRKAKHAKEIDTVVTNRVSYVKKPFAQNSLFCIGLAVVAVAFLTVGLVGAVRTQGQAALHVGAFGLCSLLVSLVAVWYGIRSFREKDKNYILARIGSGIGVALILVWIIMIIIGVRA